MNVAGRALTFAGTDQAPKGRVFGNVCHAGFAGLQEGGKGVGGHVECRRDSFETDAAGARGPVAFLVGRVGLRLGTMWLALGLLRIQCGR